MSEPVVVPSARDVRASLDSADEGVRASLDSADEGVRASLDSADGETEPCVVACPPHPQHRGHRGDDRLVAISDVLTAGGVDCLRFDYGEWDEGYGELGDVYAALEWASERYDRVGLTGFSFGGCLSLLAAGGTAVDGSAAARPDIEAVSALAPPSRVNDDLVALPAMERIDVPAQVAYGSRDDIADWEPVVERARELDWTVTELSGGHLFVGRTDVVGEIVGEFLLDAL